MSLYIGFDNDSSGKKLRLEGRLDAEVVPELNQAVESSDSPVRVDLSELYSADDAGIGALQRLASQGVELLGVRPLIEYRLYEDDEDVPVRT